MGGWFRSKLHFHGVIVVAALAISCSSADELQPRPKGPGDIQLTIESFTASPALIDHGAGATLHWATKGASAITISAGTTVLREAADPNGLLEVEPEQTTTYTLIATGAEGAEETATATVQVRPIIQTFSADAADEERLPGAPVLLSWETGGAATSLTLRTGEGFSYEVPEGARANGSAEAPLPEDGIFILEARSEELEAYAEVTVRPRELDLPVIARFEADPPAFVRSEEGSAVTIHWEVRDTASLRLFLDGVEQGLSQETSGGAGTFEAHLHETTTARLEATNEKGEAAEELVIAALTPALIERFVADPEELRVGEALTLSWKMGAGDPDLTISITDELGLSYELGGASPFDGSIILNPTAPGTKVYELVASSPGTEPATASVKVSVLPLPTLTLAATPEALDPLVQETATLEWTSGGATRLTIWELDDDGAPIEPPLVDEEDPAQMAAGSFSFEPERSATYRAVVEDALGPGPSAEVTVELLLVEITSFEATPTVVAENGVSELSWTTERATHVTIDYESTYAFREGKRPFIDLSKDGKELELKGNCENPKGGNEAEDACPQFSMGDFAFTFGSRSFDKARASVNGFLTFEDEFDVGEARENHPLPFPHPRFHTKLAVLWDELIADLERSKIFYGGGNDEERGRTFIVSWHDFFLKGKEGPCSVSGDFQIVLFEDGGFDYRYRRFGDSSAAPDCMPLSATVGYYHTFDGGDAFQVSYNTEPPGGFNELSYEFKPFAPVPNMSLPVTVPVSRSFTLTAHGAKGSVATKTLFVEAVEPPKFLYIRDDGVPGVVGEPKGIAWKTSLATEVEVAGPDGSIVCPASFNNAREGACEVTSSSPGPTLFRLRARGESGVEIVESISLRFFEPLEIVTFEVIQNTFELGGEHELTLSWETLGAASFTLLENGATISIPTRDWAAGSTTRRIDRSATYTLRIVSADRPWITSWDWDWEKEETLDVRVKALEPRRTEAIPPQVRPGEEVRLSWDWKVNADEAPFVSLQPQDVPMVEVTDGSARFQDISANGVEVPGFRTVGNATASPKVRLPFDFRYYGKTYEEVLVYTTGFVTFEQTSIWGIVIPLLEWSTYGNDKPNLAPYWSRIRTYDRGNAYTKFVEVPGSPADDHFVIQWDRMQLQKSPIPPPGSSNDELSFQLVLFRDGRFEYRYGTMSTPTNPDAAKGRGATAGYRKPGVRLNDEGHEIFFDPSNPIPLEDRTWRYTPLLANDTIVLRPTESTHYSICMEVAGDRKCETVAVAVPKRGDLIVTELDVIGTNPVDIGVKDPLPQWFEVRNVSTVPIYLDGMELSSATGSYPLSPSAPLAIQPGGYVVLGSSTKASEQVDYVYDSRVRLGDGVDGIDLRYGDVSIAKVSWDASWTFPKAKTLSLDPKYHVHGGHSVDDFAMWCEDSAVGSPHGAFGCASPYYDFDPLSSKPFIDIRKTGAMPRPLPEVGVIPGGLGFTMPFFDEDVRELWYSKFGYVGLSGAPFSTVNNLPIPGAAETGIVAALWTALREPHVEPERSSFTYERREIDGQRLTILQWSYFRKPPAGFGLEHPGWVSFQIQLWESGDIVLTYRNIEGDPHHFGSAATVGIEAVGGEEGIQYLHKQALLQEGQSLYFKYRAGTP